MGGVLRRYNRNSVSADSREEITRAGRTMRDRFDGLGSPLTGLTRDHIIRSVGVPQGVSAHGHGRTHLQWVAIGFHIGLMFDADGICEGITNRFAL